MSAVFRNVYCHQVCCFDICFWKTGMRHSSQHSSWVAPKVRKWYQQGAGALHSVISDCRPRIPQSELALTTWSHYLSFFWAASFLKIASSSGNLNFA
jgi:hypothetical protein